MPEVVEDRASLGDDSDVLPAEYLTDRVLVRLRTGATMTALTDAFVESLIDSGCRGTGADAPRPCDLPAGEALGVEPLDDGPNAAVLKLPPGASVPSALAWLAKRPEVLFAEPDYIVVDQALPNDPLYAIDQGYLAAINAPQAWDIQTGSSNVVVAVLDSGIEVDHPDLNANIWTNPLAGSGDCGNDVHGCNFVPAGSGGSSCGATAPVRTPDITPTRWHGTFVAGVIGAAGNNGRGVSGVAWNVALMPVRVANCRGDSDTASVVDAIHYAVDRGARVVDISAGTSRLIPSGCRAPGRFVADAVQYARDHDVLVVAPAGNDNHGCVDDPAAAPGVLAVGGAQTPGNTRWLSSRGATGSNWGPEVTVAAPAANITSTIPRRAGEPPNDLYATSSGTSLAAPIVAGEAALLLSQNPQLTPDWLTELIALGAHRQPNGDTPGWAGAGTVDLAASLRLVPAAFSGSLTVSGSPAPDGTLLEAFMQGRLCAQSSSFSNAAGSTYALIVPAAAMQAGCGVPGATVEIHVNGVAAAEFPWAPAAYPTDVDVSAVDPGVTD